MDEENRHPLSKRVEGIVAGTLLDHPLAAVWNTAPFLNALFGVSLKDYYLRPDIKLNVQLEFQNLFPEFICFPGIWADYGALCEPSAFGCPISWPDGGMPAARPAATSISEAIRLRPPDPNRDGYMPKALEEYRYFWDHLDSRYIEEYGYLDGAAASFGPVELAAVLIGHEHLFLSMFQKPAATHELLKIVTDSVITWLRAHEPINGKLKRVHLADHLPGQLDPSNFEEFWLPYTNMVRDAFPEAMMLYHNEYPIRYVDRLLDFGPHIFHFGGDVRSVKAALGNRITLMGNLHPINVMLHGTPTEVKQAALTCLAEGAPGGRFLLSTAGGLAPGTSFENLKALSEAVREFTAG